jgi:hypothetical protein
MADADTTTFMMSLKAARLSFASATLRLKALVDEQASLQEDVIRLRRTIAALSAMCSESPALDNLGITDSCAQVMEAAMDTMTTKNVVRALDAMGFDLASQKNATALVHSVLARLALTEKIERTSSGSEIVWKGPNYDPAIPF